MFDLDRWLEIYASISKHKLRTFLTAFGVFWGIFMLIVLLGAGKGFKNGIEGSFDIAKNALFVWSQRTSEPYMGFEPGRIIRFTNQDVEAIRENIPEVDVISPRNVLRGDFAVVRKDKNAAFEVFGDYPDFMKLKALEIEKGRFINHFDILKKRKVVVIGEQVHKQLFKEGENPIGEYIKIQSISFKVVGVFRSKGDAEDQRESARVIHMPNTTMQYTYNQINRIFWFGFVPKKGVSTSLVEEKVKKLLVQRHKVAPNDLKAFGSANIEEEYQRVQGLFWIIGAFSWFVSFGAILAGVIGVGNIMLIIVRERTKEIGVRKALGATPWSVISMIIQESLLITGLAGYTGLVVGTGLIAFINYLLKEFDAESQFFANPEVDMTVAISAVILLMITGVIAGLIPATKAASINPVVALKDE